MKAVPELQPSAHKLASLPANRSGKEAFLLPVARTAFMSIRRPADALAGAGLTA